MPRTWQAARPFALLACWCAALASGRADAASYTFVDLGGLPGYQDNGATGINNEGQIVGVSAAYGPTSNSILKRAFLYSNGTMTPVGEATAKWVSIGINDNGPTVYHWVPFARQSVSWVNDAGQAIEGHQLTSGGQSISLGDFYAIAINNHGEIAGMFHGADRVIHPAIYQDGKMTDLSKQLNGDGDVAFAAYAINDRGDILYSTSLGHGIRYADGMAQPLNFYPTGINNLGQVVGRDNAGRGVLYQDGITTTLASLLPPSPVGLDKFSPEAINDAGQIVGGYLIDGYNHPFLLDPVPAPEPSTLVMLLLAGGGLGLRTALRRLGP